MVAVHKAWGLGGTTLLGRQDGREGEEWRKEAQTPLEKGGACWHSGPWSGLDVPPRFEGTREPRLPRGSA